MKFTWQSIALIFADLLMITSAVPPNDRIKPSAPSGRPSNQSPDKNRSQNSGPSNFRRISTFPDSSMQKNHVAEPSASARPKNLRRISGSFRRPFSSSDDISSRLEAMPLQSFSNVFNGERDRFKGIMIILSRSSNRPDKFEEKLIRSLNIWTKDDISTVWFQIALEYSECIPVLAKHGFLFHRTTLDGKSVVMYKWMRNSPSSIPEYSHTMVGVGAVVVNKKKELLLVKEWYNEQLWRLPGGYVDPDEDLFHAAEREVWEETGIESQFDSLISFRHTHKTNFGCSDLDFIVKLTPTGDLTLNCDRGEILECRWMSIDEYLNSSDADQLNKDAVRHYLKCEMNKLALRVKKGQHSTLKKIYSVYQVDTDLVEKHRGSTQSSRSPAPSQRLGFKPSWNIAESFKAKPKRPN